MRRLRSAAVKPAAAMLIRIAFDFSSLAFKRKMQERHKAIPAFLEKEEDIDIKIRSVSNWKFRFQSQNFCFKLDFFVSKCFFAVKTSENNRFFRSPESDDKCRLHRKWCRRRFAI